MKPPKQIIREAIEQYKPVHALLLFSGGHDSLVNTHVCANIMQEYDIPFEVYHGDTGIGIPETREYVKNMCKKYGWPLVIKKPPKETDQYEHLVKKYGFPGPTKLSHQICFRHLKERALNRYITHNVKSSVQAREHVLLLSGLRKNESMRRMGYDREYSKENSKIWCNPIFYWSKENCEKYMRNNNLPRNPVKDRICISGECLCGAFAGKEEWAEIKTAYPAVARKIEKLHALAKQNGFPWPWSQGPTEWYQKHPPGVIDMFKNKANPMPMCVGCATKNQ